MYEILYTYKYPNKPDNWQVFSAINYGKHALTTERQAKRMVRKLTRLHTQYGSSKKIKFKEHKIGG